MEAIGIIMVVTETGRIIDRTATNVASGGR